MPSPYRDAKRDAIVAELTLEGMTAEEIAYHLDINPRTVQRARVYTGVAQRQGRRYTSEEDAKGRQLLADGAPLREVAETLGRSRHSVQAHFNGLSKCTGPDGRIARETQAQFEEMLG